MQPGSGRRQGHRHHHLDSSLTWAIRQVSPSRSGRCRALSSSFLHPIVVVHCRLCGPYVAIKHCVVILRHNTCSHSCSHQCTLEELHACMERPSLALHLGSRLAASPHFADSTTNAAGTSCEYESGTPTPPTSAAASCLRRNPSSSAGAAQAGFFVVECGCTLNIPLQEHKSYLGTFNSTQWDQLCHFSY